MGVRAWGKQRSFRRFLIPAAAGWSVNRAQDLVSKIQNLENTLDRIQGLVLLPPGTSNVFTTKPAFSTCIMGSSSAGIFLKHLHKTGWSTIKRKQPRVNTKVM